jgi:hypothetical protein
MNKLIAQVLLVLIIFTLDGCNLTRRKYRPGFYRHKHEKPQRHTSSEHDNLSSGKRNSDTFLLRKAYADTLHLAVLPEIDTLAQISVSKNDETRVSAPNHKKHRQHTSVSEHKYTSHSYSYHSYSINDYKPVKVKKAKVWWELYGKKFMLILFILLSVSAAVIILFSFPITLGSLSWAWFALSLIPAAILPHANDAMDNKTLLFLLGLLAFNVPIPLAFLGRFLLSLNLNIFILLALFYVALVFAASIVSLAFDPETSWSTFVVGMEIGAVLAVIILLILVVIDLAANFPALAVIAICILGTLLLLFFGLVFFAMAYSR